MENVDVSGSSMEIDSDRVRDSLAKADMPYKGKIQNIFDFRFNCEVNSRICILSNMFFNKPSFMKYI